MPNDFDLLNQLLPGLPAFTGGHMADNVYDTGRGRFARYNDDRPFTFEMESIPADSTKILKRFQLAGCDFHIMEHTDAKLHLSAAYEDSAYEIIMQGSQIHVIPDTQNAARPHDEPCLERAVTDTTFEAFESYLHQLEQLGYVRIWENQIEKNLYRELQKDGRLLYATYMGNTCVARFITDSVSAPITDMSGGTALPGEKAALCQFGLFYDNMVSGVSANCGMLYILKLPDRSLFLIDGGEYEQATEAATKEVLRIMRGLSGTVPGEKIPVSGWFCTHAHDDHMDLVGKLIRFYHDEIDLQRIIFNFPAFSEFAIMPSVYIMLDRLNRYYPNSLYLKPHAGQEFSLAGAKFLFLQTHEDSIDAAGNEKIGGFNDTSTVLKISFDGVSFMVMGDIDKAAERILLTHYGPETLHATAVQPAHHLFNLLNYAYAAISPDMALVPTHIRKADSNTEKYQALAKSVPPDQIYFASEGSSIWTVQEQTLKLAKLYPVMGGLFDGLAI